MMKRLILALAFVLATTLAHAQTTINNLGAGSVLTGTEQIPMYQGSNPATATTPNAIRAAVSGLNNALTYSCGIAIGDGGTHTVSSAPAGSCFNGKTTLAGLAASFSVGVFTNVTTPAPTGGVNTAAGAYFMKGSAWPGAFNSTQITNLCHNSFAHGWTSVSC